MTAQFMAAQRNWGARLHDVTLRGAPAVVLENELPRVTVLLHGGVEIRYYRPSGC